MRQIPTRYRGKSARPLALFRPTSGVWWYEFVLSASVNGNLRRHPERLSPVIGRRTAAWSLSATSLRGRGPKVLRGCFEQSQCSSCSSARIPGLLDLTEPRISAYMRTRYNEGAGHRTTNMELQCLSRASWETWRQLRPNLPILAAPSDTGRAISAAEERRLPGAVASALSDRPD
jgi:hypothetical protein